MRATRFLNADSLIFIYILIKLQSMKKVYPKSFGGFSYEILDEEAYERFWYGKKPSTKALFEIWLNDPDKTQHELASETDRSIYVVWLNLTEMKKQGIIRRFKRDDYDPSKFIKFKRRSQMEIFAEILLIAQDGSKKTKLVYLSNTNFKNMMGYLSDLIERGLIEVDGRDYITTEKGNKFLEQYQILMQT